MQGRRKHRKLGGALHFKGTFFIRKRGHFLKIKKGTSLFIAKSWGAHAPSAPRFLCLWGHVSIHKGTRKGHDPEVATAHKPQILDGGLALLGKILTTFTDSDLRKFSHLSVAM